MMAQSLTKEEEQLLQLCRDKNAPISQFAALLDRGVGLNIHDKEGKHPLSWVSYHGRRDLADLFLRHGAKVDLATNDKYGETALITTCTYGHLETAKLLIHRGAVVNFQRKDGFTALYFASLNNHLEVVKFLLESGAQVNKGTQTSLCAASLKGNLKVVQYLLDHRADVNLPNDDKLGETALITACGYGHLETAKLLIHRGAVVNFQRKNGATALTFASQHDHINVVRFLLESGAQINEGKIPPLYGASLGGNPKVAQYLLDHGADVNQPTDDKPYASPLITACYNNHLQVAELLINNGANINYKDSNGNTALHWASMQGHPEVVKVLVQSHANVNIKSYDFPFGRTPLQLAKTPEIVSLLKPTADQCTQCSRKFTLYRRQHNCHRCLAPVCDNCSKHKLPISDPSSKPEKVCDRCFDDLRARRKNESQPLSADELRILNIVLVEYVDKLNNVGLHFEAAIADQPATDQPVVTKKRVVECLQQIGQRELAGILIKNQGIKELQDHVYRNVYESALRSEKAEVRLQVFKMILSGVPRSGKTTFWKRLAMKDFEPSETSTSTGAAESHFLSAHMSTEMLLDLHLYSETDTKDLTTEALTIYKRILEAAPTQIDSSQSASVVPLQSLTASPEEESTSVNSKLVSEENDQSQATNTQTPEEYNSSQCKPQSTDPDTNQQFEASTASQISMSENEQRVPVKFAYHEIIDEEILAAQKQGIEQISKEINEYFNELTSLLRKGEKVPTNIPLIKKICHLIDTGGQRAFLELLPTVTVGKALYLLFFSYEHFDNRIHETVQQQGASTEVQTGTFYKQMDIVMQSLICVSSTSSVSKDNVALLIGTHVDKVESQHVEDVNRIVSKKVEPFLKSGLVFADEEKDKMVLEVSIEKTKRCSNRPEDYRKVILDIAENKLSCPESEKLPPSWYMFSIVLRRMKIAGHSVLRYTHCQQIASKLYIKETQLQSLLSRLHKILGIVMYFPEIRELEDIVICDPSIVYRGISELIFNSFTKISTVLSLRLKKWGMFTYRELKEHCKSKSMNKGCQLLIDQLIIILQHLGVIAPVQFSEPDDSSAEPKDEEHSSQCIDTEFIIPAVLNDARQEELKLQVRNGEACSIIPLRIYFKCGFSPMGGFCYLFTRLISDRKWKLPLEKEEMMTNNQVYWRNKATFIVEADQKKYLVTLVSTKIYYEIHIVHTHSKEPFQLGTDGRNICRKVWYDIKSVISNSLNAPLKEYTVACQCTLHGNEELEHVMKFESKPHDEIEIKATCLLDRNRPHPLTVDTSKQSVIVWFKEPHDHRVKDLGSVTKLPTDHLFMATTSSCQFKYQWSRIINDEEEKIEDEECFKNSDSNTLVIDGFEIRYAGTYRCVISTSSQPVVSMSAEVELDLPEPPEEFSTEMSNRQFLLYLNANGIHYDVCKKLKGNKITAKEFNLDSYKFWPLDLNLTFMEKKALLSLLVVADYMKCPVCLNVQIDPCTLSCGHTFCQLCLAHMWKNNDKSCPVCKETWKALPGVSYSYRTNIECTHSREVEQLRKQYTFEENQLIKEFLEAKESFNQKSGTLLQELDEKNLPERSLLRFTNFKYLDHEQLYMWLCDHPRFVGPGVDYRHDIGKLKDAKISGNVFLSLDKDSLEYYGLSTEFQTPLMKIVEEVKTYPQSPETKLELQPHQQKSLESVIAAAKDSSGKDIQSTEKGKPKIEETDAAQSISAQATDLAMWKLPGVEECGETSVIVHSYQGQLVEWNGLKLHIHAGSLPEGLQQCTIFIRASLAGDYEIPENTSLVSGIFWLRCEPQCIFIKPIIVEIQHCSTKRDLSKLKIVRAFCNQKSLPYKFKPLGGSFNADTFYGAIDMKGFSGVGVVEENPDSERMYYSQLFYRSCLSDQQRHEIHIIFVWNTELHLNHISWQYPEDSFLAGYHKVIEIEGKVIEVVLDAVKWTKVMDGQWEIQPAQPTVTKAALDDFKPGRGLPSCVLEARPLCEDFPQLLHQVILNGIKPPHHKVILSYMPSRMNRDYPSGASVQQPQSPPTVQMSVDVRSQSLTFSKDMSCEQLAQWLRNHPSLSGADYEEDMSKLRDARINGHVFLSLNESRLERFSVSVGFQFAIMNIIEDTLQKSSHQPPSSERLPLQQQSPRSSVATPRTTQHQLSSSTAGQQTKLEPVPHPQALSSDQPKLDVPPQPLEFSKDMSYEQLAVWLTNHPRFVGADYQQDISKLKDAKINSHALLSLNKSRLERSGVSLGFQCTLMDVIENLKSRHQGRDSEGLPPQPESPSNNLTSRQLPTFESTTGQQNQTKLNKKPTLDELLILKYTDKGEKMKIRIIKETCHMWKDIVTLICNDRNVIKILEQKCHGDPKECLIQAFIDNFINKKPTKYSQDWNGLIELLDDVDLETLAKDVKHALSCDT